MTTERKTETEAPSGSVLLTSEEAQTMHCTPFLHLGQVCNHRPTVYFHSGLAACPRHIASVAAYAASHEQVPA